MTFAHPWLLLGWLAALLPLLVHLFDRRRPRPHPFGPLAFVLRSQRRTASRLKLRRLLLYALRTFLFLAFPLALARPEWRRDAPAVTTQQGPAATAILLDASLSMRYQDGETLFERGRAEARAALNALQPGEPATLLVCGMTPAPGRPPHLDRAALVSELDAALPSFGPVDMARCLERAARALEESSLSAKRLVVVSSFVARNFSAELPLPKVLDPQGRPVQPRVELRDAAGGRATLPNHSVSGLMIEAAPHAGLRAYQLTFSVKNHSAQPLHDLTLSLRSGSTVLARGFVDVPAGGTARKVFTQRFEAGGVVQGDISLPPDALPDDDRLPFVLRVPSELKALLVNGAPSPVRQKDEAFFAEAALRAQGSPVALTVRDAEAAWHEDLSQYALLLLLNVEAPPPEVAARIQKFVEAGGGLFIAVGDHVQPDAYNARLAGLLPRPLHVLRTAGKQGEDDEGMHLGEASARHPIFALFTGSAQEGLLSARFFRYFLLQPQPRSTGASEVLATFEDGAPALVEARRGKGRVALWTSTVDRDWTDLPIRTSFLPLIQRICAQLTGALEEREPVHAQVGERAQLPGASPSATQVKSPSGAMLALESAPDGSLRTPPLSEPGVYTVMDARGQPLPALSFATTLDPSESDLTRLMPEALSHSWGQEVVVTSGRQARQTPVPVWTWILVAAAAAFLGEGLLLRKP